MKILLDVMGGDYAPDEMIKGAVDVINELESEEVILIGDEKVIKEKVKEIYNKEDISELNSKLKIKHASEIITNEESPTEAIKHKKDASMVVGFKMLKEGEGDVLVSAGSTGAFMAGGILKVGRIKGIDRPALCPMLPTYDGKGFMLIDSGANSNCRPINLYQFAKMGSIYMKEVEGRENPSIGLLNIGAEESKGTELLKESYEKIREDKEINFYGNIEGRYIFDGDVDVVVADGFTGNVTLKTVEGMGATVNKMLKEELYKNLWTKILAFLLLPALKKFKKRMDYTEYGGALLIGINKPMIKCHGSAKAKLVKKTLLQAEKVAKHKMVDSIKESIQEE